MPRFLKYSASSIRPLRLNTKHNLASLHALNIYKSDSIFSFIPKNACSTMRLSIAYANGCIDDVSDFKWIHKNNETFSANIADLAKAKYTFTILRCPYSRLASAFMDKIVGKERAAWNFFDLTNRTIDLDKITFSDFVHNLKHPHVKNGDIHWRPQSDFLVYKQYDDYFSLSDFDNMKTVLKDKISLELFDARSLTNHGTNQLKTVDSDCYTSTPGIELAAMKAAGCSPSYASLFNDETISTVQQIYDTDILTYQEYFLEKGLLFN